MRSASVCLAVAWLVVACGGSPLGTGNAQCGRDGPGSYPPPTITITGSQSMAVPWTSWECTGYNADTFEEPVPITLGEDNRMVLEVPLEAGAELEVRLDGRNIDVDPSAPRQEIVVPVGVNDFFVRLCTDDGRCANYQASFETG